MDPHFQELGELVALEAQAAADQARARRAHLSPRDAEQSGASLLDLVVEEESAGLGGRALLTLRKRRRAEELPWNRLGVGAPVALSEEGGARAYRAVVHQRTREQIVVALDEAPDDPGPTLRLDLADDAVASERQLKALERAARLKRERGAELREVLLGSAPASFVPSEERLAWRPVQALDDSQVDAVDHALAARDVALIHGPPGTGKTTAVIELLLQVVSRRQRALAVASSNLAADNLLERLVRHGVRAVRLGHPARVSPELLEHSLDLLVEEHEDLRLARKRVKEALALRRQAARHTRARPEPGTRQRLWSEARLLLDDARRLEAQAVERVLDGAAVLVGTTSLDEELLARRRFDWVVIDEACQSTEPGVWAPILRAERLVLAGDHRQLPPTVLSSEAAARGLGVSLFERLAERSGPLISRQLTVQYRMHEAIMRFSSERLYAGSLRAHPSVAGHLLADLPGVRADPLTQTPLLFIDTAGAGLGEEKEADGESRLNPGEGERVVDLIGQLLERGVPGEHLAVITPYAAQVRWLERRLEGQRPPRLEIDSVDGFQGREKEVVLISLVRSNEAGEIGFLADVRRMNVALTRARRKLVVVGDSATIGGHPFYADLLGYFERAGGYRSVWEL